MFNIYGMMLRSKPTPIGPVHATAETRGFVYYHDDDVTGASATQPYKFYTVLFICILTCVILTSFIPTIPQTSVHTPLAVHCKETSSFTYKELFIYPRCTVLAGIITACLPL